MISTLPRFMQQRWPWLVLLIVLAGAALLVTHRAWVQFDARTAAIHAAHERLNRKEQRLAEIYHGFGYGGFIHNFKNYLLRGDADLLDRLETQGQDLHAQMDAYRELTSLAGERLALDQLRATLDAYQAKIPLLVAGQRAGQAIQTTDRQVRIDDGPALAALAEIRRLLSDEYARSGKLLVDTQTAGQRMLWNLFGIIVLMFLLGLLTLALSRSLWQALRREQQVVGDLREQRDFTQAILDATADVVITIDQQGGIRQVNHRVESMLGYTPGELIGQNISQLIPLDVASAKVIGRQRIMAVRHRDGHEIPAELSIRQLERQGEVFFTGLLSDVSAQRMSEKTLRELKTTLDQTHDCIFIFEPDTLRFVYVNHGASGQVGYDQSTLLKMRPFEIKPDFDEQLFRALIEPVRRGELPELRFETRHRHRDGHDIPVEIFLQYLAPEGQSPRFVAVVRDIAERQEYQRNLDRQRRNLAVMNAISERSERDFGDRLRAALVLAANHLELEIGIVSRIDGQDYYVDYQVAPSHFKLSDGQHFDLKTTYCDLTLERDDVLAIPIMGQSSYRSHRCYRLLNLESYLGIPLRLPSDGRRYGAVNFSSRQPRPRPFERADEDFLRLFARWVGATLEINQVHEALRVSESRMQRSQTFANIGTWDWSIQTGALYWSERIAPLLGYGERVVETTYAQFLAAIHPEDRDAVAAAVTACVEENADYDIEHRVVWDNGEIRWLHERGDVVRAPDGTPLQMLGVVQDISERRQAQEALSRFKQLAEATEQAIGLATLDRKLVYVNPAHCRLLGYERPEQLLDHDWMECLPEHARSAARELDEHFQQGQRSQRLQVPMQRRDGSEFIALVNLGVIRDHQGRPQLAFNIFEDYTEELARQQQVLAAKEAAEQANQAKSAFLSRMSHELRTPLNAILGFAQLLASSRRAPLPERQLKQVSHIEQSGRHLLALINEILDLARIESGRLSLSLETLDFDEVLTEALDMVSSQAEARNIKLRRAAAPDAAAPDASVSLVADRLRLRQVLVNLLSNAIKYNRDGGQVTIATAASHDHFIRIAIRDTGVGIAADQIEQVFEPFNRLDADRTNVEGTGIGLTLVREFVTRMHGRLGVQSEVDQGSTFWIELPRDHLVTGTDRDTRVPASSRPE